VGYIYIYIYIYTPPHPPFRREGDVGLVPLKEATNISSKFKTTDKFQRFSNEMLKLKKSQQAQSDSLITIK